MVACTRRYAASTATVLNDRARTGQDAIRFGAGAPGLQRAAVRLRSCRFSPHRHDSYAIGITTTGVQSFRYRGSRHICLPGQLHVLHPDELHDGAAATDEGFGYRIVYVDPELVRDALGGGALPFAAEPVHDVTARMAAGCCGCWPTSTTRSTTSPARRRCHGGVALCELAGQPGGDAGGSLDLAAMARVREHLAAHAREQTPAAELERIAGLDRYTIARQFRRAYGTSPDRFRTMRRLDLARAAIGQGHAAGRGRARGRLQRPEPHDPPVPARLRDDAGAVGEHRRCSG